MAKATRYRAEAMRLRDEAAKEVGAEFKKQLLRMANQYDRLAISVEEWAGQPMALRV